MRSNEAGSVERNVIAALEEQCRRQREIAFRMWADARIHKGAVDLVIVLEGRLFDLTHAEPDAVPHTAARAPRAETVRARTSVRP